VFEVEAVDVEDELALLQEGHPVVESVAFAGFDLIV
jgi:hypothetical protein